MSKVAWRSPSGKWRVKITNSADYRNRINENVARKISGFRVRFTALPNRTNPNKPVIFETVFLGLCSRAPDRSLVFLRLCSRISLKRAFVQVSRRTLSLSDMGLWQPSNSTDRRTYTSQHPLRFVVAPLCSNSLSFLTQNATPSDS